MLKEDPSFSPRLTAIRQARGMTQVQRAEATGGTQRSISYYENDDGIPPASIVISSLAAIAAPRKNGTQGERYGR